MTFTVTCPACIGRIAEFPDSAGAEGLVSRHHLLTGHTAVVERVLATPLEGLLG
jgi:hypothetical protein